MNFNLSERIQRVAFLLALAVLALDLFLWSFSLDLAKGFICRLFPAPDKIGCAVPFGTGEFEQAKKDREKNKRRHAHGQPPFPVGRDKNQRPQKRKQDGHRDG
jgi:hypothetical protein